MQTKEQRIEYLKKRKEIVEDNYNMCKDYFVKHGIPLEEISSESYCGYLLGIVEFWNKKLEEAENEKH